MILMMYDWTELYLNYINIIGSKMHVFYIYLCCRLNRAYSLADRYVNIFMTPILTVLAK